MQRKCDIKGFIVTLCSVSEHIRKNITYDIFPIKLYFSCERKLSVCFPQNKNLGMFLLHILIVFQDIDFPFCLLNYVLVHKVPYLQSSLLVNI